MLIVNGSNIRTPSQHTKYYHGGLCTTLNDIGTSSSLTSLLLHIQCDLNPFINKLHSLFKVCLLELSGGQSWSSWKKATTDKRKARLKKKKYCNFRVITVDKEVKTGAV